MQGGQVGQLGEIRAPLRSMRLKLQGFYQWDFQDLQKYFEPAAMQWLAVYIAMHINEAIALINLVH